MPDTPKQWVGGPMDRDMTEDEAYQYGLMLFDAINAERDNQSQGASSDESPANGD